MKKKTVMVRVYPQERDKLKKMLAAWKKASNLDVKIADLVRGVLADKGPVSK